MFVPRSEAELAEALESAALVETASFEGKAFPTSSKGNVEIAKDIAAMATDGGVIIYGIGEDSLKRLTIDRAFRLAGQRERISNIVSTILSDPPTIRITPVEKSAKPEFGYLIVEVPQSPRAPHMVQVKGENRFYGRDATGNRVLTAGDVERLYSLRAGWERGIDDLLEHAISHRPGLPFPPEGRGLFHAVARPLTADDAILARALKGFVGSTAPMRMHFFEIGFLVSRDWIQTALGLLASERSEFGPAELEVRRDGTARFFWVATMTNSDGALVLRDADLAHFVDDLCTGLGRFYDAAGLTSAVDLGMALRGARGAGSALLGRRFDVFTSHEPHLRSDEYRETTRTSVAELLAEPTSVARALLDPLFAELTQRIVDPFARM